MAGAAIALSAVAADATFPAAADMAAVDMVGVATAADTEAAIVAEQYAAATGTRVEVMSVAAMLAVTFG